MEGTPYHGRAHGCVCMCTPVCVRVSRCPCIHTCVHVLSACVFVGLHAHACTRVAHDVPTCLSVCTMCVCAMKVLARVVLAQGRGRGAVGTVRYVFANVLVCLWAGGQEWVWVRLWEQEPCVCCEGGFLPRCL